MSCPVLESLWTVNSMSTAYNGSEVCDDDSEQDRRPMLYSNECGRPLTGSPVHCTERTTTDGE